MNPITNVKHTSKSIKKRSKIRPVVWASDIQIDGPVVVEAWEDEIQGHKSARRGSTVIVPNIGHGAITIKRRTSCRDKVELGRGGQISRCREDRATTLAGFIVDWCDGHDLMSIVLQKAIKLS